MPRIRTVKPAYPKHKKVRAVSRDARLLNIHLWNLADDEGRLQELLQWIIGEVFPTDEDVTPVVLREWLAELEEAGLIVRYEVDAERYIQCHDFNEHQVINKAKPSEIPPCPTDCGQSGSPPVPLREVSRPEEEEEPEQETEETSNSSARANPSAYPAIVSALDAVAFARSRPSPKVPAVEAACAEYAHLDLKAEVANFAHYFTEGPGAKRKLDDVAWKWRQWLGNVKDGGAKTGGKKARDSVADDLKKLEAAHQQALREEAAA